MIEDQLQHRTIRFFEDKPVAEDVMDQVYDVYNRTATSNGLQTTTLIRITDPGLKQGIAEIADQAYIAKMPELFIFLADSRRLTRIAQKEGGSAKQYKTMDQFMQGVADSYLASQNVANALEELGLGTVFWAVC